MIYDVAVLGGGPGGYEAAIRCARYGLKTALIEAGELGGACLNRGCIPTKALLHCAELYHNAAHAADFGIETNTVNFDYAKMAAYKERIVEHLRRGIASLEKAHGVTVIRGFGILQDANTLIVNGEPVSAANMILAVGSAPSRPPIPGIDGRDVLTSDEVLSLTTCPDRLVIIGGGVIGIEFATLFATLGRPVTVLEMLPSILPGVDREIVAALTHILEETGVRIVTGAKVTAIRSGKEANLRQGDVCVEYEYDGDSKQAAGTCCIVSVGRIPRTTGIGLDQVGIAQEKGFIRVDETMRTNIPHIYAIGDITGKIQLAHVATTQGMIAAANCAGKQDLMDYSSVPACVYTSPEIAYIGITAEEAGRPVKVGSFDLAGNGKAMIMGEKRGLVKIVSDPDTGEILGAQILAPRATDMIAEIAAIMRCEGTVEELAATIHPHPTVSEIIMEAAHDTEGMCCNAPPKTMKEKGGAHHEIRHKHA
ncbi:MAG: dihydrolipoyl dehydrogenase [Peptococcaceae bacterium]|nr:dihydrolipoyl dehydrogenase [Peptococcaceae bacterium]